LAITKERKEELVSQYVDWINSSQAIFVTEYTGLTMKQIEDLRAKAREAGGVFHIAKNTLTRLALERAGYRIPDELVVGSTAIGFALEDAPALAKAMSDFARTSDKLKLKGGYLHEQPIKAADITALAELPPLPVMRSQLLGVLLAPAGKLVRTLAEPGRALAAVLQANLDKQNAPAEAPAA
jgi:large subunit ribosomal protein L10